MSLQSGQKLAHYEILEPIGKGGMGEVYRAKDSKLGRDVAIKILPDEFAKDEERLRRFQREAKVLASLNHPNIASIYGLEQSESTHYLVLELVPGETLAERIARGPIPADEAVEIATKIAEALEEAHEQGIVHRDLKPANIKRTEDGKVKVLDFGLAKAFGSRFSDSTKSESPTITREGTETGVILGTAAYMSPEQAKGKPLDRRTDVWSFGCVVFEILTGKRLFAGDNVTETLAAIVRDEPDWSLLPAGSSAALRRLLRRCLEKDRNRRWQHMGDARLELHEASSPEAAVAEGSESRSVWSVGAVVITVFLLGIVGWMVSRLLAPDASQSIARLSVTFPPEQTLLRQRVYPAIAMAPGGDRFAYVAEVDGVSRLYLREMSRFEARLVPDTENVHTPFFSPDGQWVAFYGVGGDLRKVPVTGGAQQLICEATATITAPGASWGDDDTIVFSSGTGLLEVPASGGEPRSITDPDESGGESGHAWPHHLPGSSAIVFSVSTPKGRRPALLDRKSGRWTILHDLGEFEQARYIRSGHLVYAQAGGLWALRFDLDGLKVNNTPILVVDDLRRRSVGGLFISEFDISSSGTLIYRPSAVTPAQTSVVVVDRKGEAQNVLTAEPGATLADPIISPDEERLAVAISADERQDIWIYDLPRGTRTRLTNQGSSNLTPRWTPDSERIVFSSNLEGFELYWKRADATGSAEAVLPPGPYARLLNSVSDDGTLIAFYEVHPETKRDIWIAPFAKDGAPQPVANSRFEEVGAKFSPVGRWVAYVSDESGRHEIYVQSLATSEGRQVISTDGGIEPFWSADGSEIFYRSLDGRQMMAVSVAAGPEFSAEAPRLLFEGDYERTAATVFANYSVSSDGKRFFMIQTGEESPSNSRLHVVLNWAQQLKRLVP